MDVPAKSSSRVRRAPVRYCASMIKVMSLKLKPGTEDEPTVTQALEGDDAPDWLAAIHSDVEQLKRRQTWNLIPRADVPSGRKNLPCSIKLKKKRLGDGPVDKRKARACTGGRSKQYGVDYDETFAAVIDFQTVRLMLSIAAKEDMFVDHVDEIGSFLYSDIDTDVFMRQPRGFEADPQFDEVRKLLKGLYGLKQGSKLCGNWLSRDMIGKGFAQMPTCPRLLFRPEK